jgi:hypothetical protein
MDELSRQVMHGGFVGFGTEPEAGRSPTILSLTG